MRYRYIFSTLLIITSFGCSKKDTDGISFRPSTLGKWYEQAPLQSTSDQASSFKFAVLDKGIQLNRDRTYSVFEGDKYVEIGEYYIQSKEIIFKHSKKLTDSERELTQPSGAPSIDLLIESDRSAPEVKARILDSRINYLTLERNLEGKLVKIRYTKKK